MNSAVTPKAMSPVHGRTRMAWPGSIVERSLPVLMSLGRSRARWAAIIAMLTLLALLSRRHHQGAAGPWAVVGALVSTAPLFLARRWPLIGLGPALAAGAAYIVLARLSWPLTSVLAWLLALAMCPLWLPRSQARVLLVLTECAVLAAVFVPASVNATPWDAHLAEALAALVAWGVGENLRSRRVAAFEQAATADKVRLLQESDAAARGRTAMARDLHDIVAHRISLIAVRAATAPYQLSELAPATAEVLAEIAIEARTALDELRTVLGVLRSPDTEALHSPQPSLADVPELLDRMRTTGMVIRLSSVGVASSLPESVELCCYRVIQEALTNAGKHAAGARVAIHLTYGKDRISVRVTDTGRTVRVSAEPGFGLVGMRERVTALGGDFAAGPSGDGFLVSVSIPVNNQQ